MHWLYFWHRLFFMKYIKCKADIYYEKKPLWLVYVPYPTDTMKTSVSIHETCMKCGIIIVPAPTTTQRLFKVMKVLSTCKRHYKIPKLKVSKQRQRIIKEGFLSVTIVKKKSFVLKTCHSKIRGEDNKNLEN